MTNEEKQIDKYESIAEELHLMMGWKVDIVGDKFNRFLRMDTPFGEFKFKAGFKTYMEDVFRFIYCYAGKLDKWATKSRIKQL